MGPDSSAKAIADLKKGELDDKIADADHRKAIINAAKRVLKVHFKWEGCMLINRSQGDRRRQNGNERTIKMDLLRKVGKAQINLNKISKHLSLKLN